MVTLLHAVVPASTFNPEKGTAFLFANWGRAWRCGRFENAQLQAIAFSNLPYFSTREEFASDVAMFRKKYPFTRNVAIQFRLFATKLIGIEEYSVK